MQGKHTIIPTSADDLNEVFDLFEHSITYQQRNGYPAWKNYDKGVLVQDMNDGRQFKIVVDSGMAMVFSITFEDKVIWGHRDKGDAIYLHRIVVNPTFKGQKLFGKLLNWAVGYAEEKRLAAIRMDTWTANPTIIDYYKGFGFVVVDNILTPDTVELPVHNRNLALTLLEWKVRDADYPPFRGSR